MCLERLIRGSSFLFWRPCNIVSKAVIGHNGEEPRTGSDAEAILALSCRVFDHLITSTAECLPNITSPVQRCLDLSKEATEWGRILDNLKKRKKARRYSDIKV